VRSVHLCPITPAVVEASVHVRHGRRSRAVAMRLEEAQGRWTCTAMDFA
jgi:rhodanese-related sulfurtransferase